MNAPVTVRDLSGAGQSLTLSEDNPNLSISAGAVNVPAGGTATFEVTLSARGATEGERDVMVSDGTTTYLITFWYVTGN